MKSKTRLIELFFDICPAAFKKSTIETIRTRGLVSWYIFDNGINFFIGERCLESREVYVCVGLNNIREIKQHGRFISLPNTLFKTMPNN
jgi:hypothetical protein